MEDDLMKQIVIARFGKEGRKLRYASPELQADKEVVMAAVQNVMELH